MENIIFVGRPPTPSINLNLIKKPNKKTKDINPKNSPKIIVITT
jgi:hypothetical protein